MSDREDLWGSVYELNKRVRTLEEQCEHLHGDIAALVGKIDYLERRANTLDAFVRHQATRRSA